MKQIDAHQKKIEETDNPELKDYWKKEIEKFEREIQKKEKKPKK